MLKFLKNIFSTLIGILLSFVVIVVILIGVLSVSSEYQKKEKKIDKNTILKIDLSTQVVERASSNPLSDLDLLNPEPKKQLELKTILDNIEKAKFDDNIIAIYINSPFVNAGLSQTEEIRNKLLEFKKTGKPIIAYSEVYSIKNYFLASVADKIYMNPLGVIDHKGLSATVMFFKGLLEKLNIDLQIFRLGKFKSAIEPFTLDKMSNENREQLKLMLNSINDNIMDSISSQRQIPFEVVKKHANQLTLNSAEICLEKGYVDHLIYEDQVEDSLIAIGNNEKLKTISLKGYSSVKSKDKDISRNKIAIIYATGEINSGKGDVASIGSKTTSAAIKKARKDKNVKAIILRVNSPGGSALASDVIWRETTLAQKEKPLVVSMGDYAASGGYYIACAADTIIANPTTLTGSIGVFGMIPNMQNFYKSNFGITVDTVKTNTYADMGTSRKLSTFEKNKIQEGVKNVYSTFISRVSDGRDITTQEVDAIGQGRVWSGYDAKDIGLVDLYGGLETAIVIAAELAEVDDYRVISLPKIEDPFTKIMNDLTESRLVTFFETEFNLMDTKKIKKVKDLITSYEIQTRIPYLIELE
ncbi:MAG: signal peptide peptidase SppA [Flavobacteriales bacterium]|nr:signal peptide peptidase SppA [Flavobacteriales bacterium]